MHGARGTRTKWHRNGASASVYGGAFAGLLQVRNTIRPERAIGIPRGLPAV
jgi:hypothetical protein